MIITTVLYALFSSPNLFLTSSAFTVFDLKKAIVGGIPRYLFLNIVVVY
jgi:hypothetical protein